MNIAPPMFQHNQFTPLLHPNQVVLFQVDRFNYFRRTRQSSTRKLLPQYSTMDYLSGIVIKCIFLTSFWRPRMFLVIKYTFKRDNQGGNHLCILCQHKGETDKEPLGWIRSFWLIMVRLLGHSKEESIDEWNFSWHSSSSVCSWYFWLHWPYGRKEHK